MQKLIPFSDIMKLWVPKVKGGWIKKIAVGKQEHFVDFSLPRNEGRHRKENLTGTYKLTFHCTLE